jgi:hypothetical protein
MKLLIRIDGHWKDATVADHAAAKAAVDAALPNLTVPVVLIVAEPKSDEETEVRPKPKK